MSAVIPFARLVPPTNKEKVWSCTACDSQRWFIVEGGALRCAGVGCAMVTELRHFDPTVPFGKV
jgi:hypothetical protein